MKAAWKFVASVLVVTAAAGRAIAGCSSDLGGTGAADGSSEAPEDHGVPQPEAAADAGATTSRDADAADAPSDGDSSADSAADAPSDGDSSADSAADGEAGDAGVNTDGSTDSPDDTIVGPGDAGPEADSETGADAGSACGTATQCLIESEGGAGCLTCTESQCPDPSLYCESFGLQTAAAGPVAGQLRKDLCLAALSCIFTSQCYLGTGVDACYCGFSESTLQCSMTGPGSDAPCVTAEQRGLETTDPGTVLNRLTDLTFGAGAANALFLCLESCPDCP